MARALLLLLLLAVIYSAAAAGAGKRRQTQARKPVNLDAGDEPDCCADDEDAVPVTDTMISITVTPAATHGAPPPTACPVCPTLRRLTRSPNRAQTALRTTRTRRLRSSTPS